jgi:hypothetical protein
MHVSSLKVPNAHAMQMHAQERTQLFIYFMLCKCMLKKGHNYLFIFQKVVSKTMRIGSRLKV